MDLVLVGVGGFAGAIARRVVDLWVSDRAGTVFPLGTLVVNLSGSFLLGLLFAWATEDLPILVEAVDEADRVRAVLPELEPMIGGGLVTLERVEVVVYRSSGS